MTCTRCGHANPEEARFCSHCGAQLSGQHDPAPQSPPDGVPAAEASPADRTSVLGHVDLYPRAAATPTAPLSTSGPETDASGIDVPLAEPLAAGTALLLVKRGPNAGSRFLLERDRTEAGRHPDSHILLDDVTVSRRHADFVRDTDGDFSVRDVGSLNGTYVNGQRIDETPLSGGDEVQIGKFRLAFFAGPGTAATAAGPAGGQTVTVGAGAGTEEFVDQR